MTDEQTESREAVVENRRSFYNPVRIVKGIASIVSNSRNQNMAVGAGIGLTAALLFPVFGPFAPIVATASGAGLGYVVNRRYRGR